jgi:hypothetical protein
MEIEAYYPKLALPSALRRVMDARARKQSLYFDLEHHHGSPLSHHHFLAAENMPPPSSGDAVSVVTAPDHSLAVSWAAVGAAEETHSDAEEPLQPFRVRSGTEISDALGANRFRFLQRQKSASAAAVLPPLKDDLNDEDLLGSATPMNLASDAEHLALFSPPLIPRIAIREDAESCKTLESTGSAKTSTAAATAVLSEPEHSDYEDCQSRKSSETSLRYRNLDRQEEEEEERGGQSRKTSDYYEPLD